MTPPPIFIVENVTQLLFMDIVINIIGKKERKTILSWDVVSIIIKSHQMQ